MTDEQKPTQPPFDGKPCPMCPMEIRNLSAVAHNLISQLDRKASECKIAETINSLRAAVKMVEPYSETHFADHAHCYGSATTSLVATSDIVTYVESGLVGTGQSVNGTFPVRGANRLVSVPFAPVQSADAPVALKKMEINYELHGRCFWHENCEKSRQGVMKIVRHEEERSLLECLNCGKSGYYPVGKVGSVFREEIDTAKVDEG